MDTENVVNEIDAEEIEGLDHDEDDSLGEYPIDTVLIRNESRTVHDVLRRIEKGSFIMDPDFQRDFIWDADKQSKLIESVLMRIPLPVFYLAENEDGQMIVVDGLQRLSTFQQFVNKGFRLKLPKQRELHGKNFDTLSAKLQNRIEDCNLTLYVIDSKVPQQALLDIFDRVNSGVPLTRQQMRNCLFTGNATRFLKQESDTDLFLQVTGRSLNRKNMRDREFMNRFCAFQILGPGRYKGDMDAFLADGLSKMNAMSQDELNNLSSKFRRSLRNNRTVFGRHAFRKHTDPDQSRSVINASLWDVMSTGMAQYAESEVEAKAEDIQGEFFLLMGDEKFYEAITLGTNQVNRVHDRFEIAHSMLERVLK